MKVNGYDILKMYNEYRKNPLAIANKIINSNIEGLSEDFKEIALGLTSDLSKNMATEIGSKKLFNYIINILENDKESNFDKALESASSIKETLKVCVGYIAPDFSNKKIEYNLDDLTKEYMLKQLDIIIKERSEENQVTLIKSKDFVGKLLYLFTNILGKTPLDTLSKSVLQYNNSVDILKKEFALYETNKTIPTINLITNTDIPDRNKIQTEKDTLVFLLNLNFDKSLDTLPILDKLVDTIPVTEKILFNNIEEYLNILNVFTQYEDISTYLNNKYVTILTNFRDNGVTEEELNNFIEVIQFLNNNIDSINNNFINVVSDFRTIMDNHLKLYMYTGKLIELIFVSGVVGSDKDEQAYEKKKQKKAEILSKLGELYRGTGEVASKDNKELP